MAVRGGVGPRKARVAFATICVSLMALLLAIAAEHGCGGEAVQPGIAEPEVTSEPGDPALGAPERAAQTALVADLPSRPIGYLGAGPWPLTTRAFKTPGMGILEAVIVGASTDEAQNLWVATNTALYLLQPGWTTFRRYTAADGLSLDNAASPGINAVIGGAANEVFVGYQGVVTTNPTITDPQRHHGKFDLVRLHSDLTIEVHFMDVHSTVSLHWWENRNVRRFAYDHFAHPHTLYIGFSHGVDLMFPDRWVPQPSNVSEMTWAQGIYADHVHPRACYHAACDPNSVGNLRLGEWRGMAIDAAGDLWMGGRYAAARIHWSSDLLFWVKSYRPFNFFDPPFGDPYPPNAPIFDPPLEGDPVSISATAVAADGRIWWASDGKFDTTRPAYGLAVLQMPSRAITILDPVALGFPTASIKDMVALPDGRLVVAPSRNGLCVWTPSTNAKTCYTTAQGMPSNTVNALWVDTMVSPPAVYAATMSGIWIGRGL
jgi:hypothetical protein